MATHVKMEFKGGDRLLGGLKQRADDIVEKTALDIQETAQNSMVGGGSPHQPSLPGEPPHRDIATLANSIHIEGEAGSGERTVGDGVEYGIHLEFSTVNMEARPWLRPAVEKRREAFFQAFRSLLNG